MMSCYSITEAEADYQSLMINRLDSCKYEWLVLTNVVFTIAIAYIIANVRDDS